MRWRSARTARSGPETDGGLARLDKDGHWQTYSEASTNGGLPPSDAVLATLPLGSQGHPGPLPLVAGLVAAVLAAYCARSRTVPRTILPTHDNSVV